MVTDIGLPPNGNSDNNNAYRESRRNGEFKVTQKPSHLSIDCEYVLPHRPFANWRGDILNLGAAEVKVLYDRRYLAPHIEIAIYNAKTPSIKERDFEFHINITNRLVSGPKPFLVGAHGKRKVNFSK